MDRQVATDVLLVSIETLRLVEMGTASFAATVAGREGDVTVNLDAETTNRLWLKMLDVAQDVVSTMKKAAPEGAAKSREETPG